MKKTLLLFLFLLPFFGISQTDLVKWNAVNGEYSPTTNANVNAENIKAFGGITIGILDYSGENKFYQTGGWPDPSFNSGEYDSSKYISLEFAPNTGYNLDLTTFSFECKSEGGSGQKFRVKCSTDINFSTGVYDLIGETSSSPSDWIFYSGNFPSTLKTVSPDKKMYIRIYAYHTYNNFQIKIGSIAAN
ncbi:MAG TPA: hypothetical protein VFQ56_04735, partial [Flavobacterium sp.]|nr:hypothetical protein [Flavobacterium sp.]